MFKRIPKRTGLLISIMLGLGIVACGVFIWGYTTGALRSSASTFGQTPIAGTISGEVHDASNSARLSGATASAKVSISILNPMGSTSGTATSGTDGVFRIQNMTSGTYNVTVTKSGYNPWSKSSVLCTFYRTSVRVGLFNVSKNFDNCNLGVINLTGGTGGTTASPSPKVSPVVSPSGVTKTGTFTAKIWLNNNPFLCDNPINCNVTLGLASGSAGATTLTAEVSTGAWLIQSSSPTGPVLTTIAPGTYTITSATLVYGPAGNKVTLKSSKINPASFTIIAGKRTNLGAAPGGLPPTGSGIFFTSQ